jgi:hypothetical protein
MLDRILSALVALSLAFLVWLYARCRDQELLDNVPVPVQITLAPGLGEQYTLEAPDVCQVAVSFTGSPSRIRELRWMLRRGELRVAETVTVPQEHIQESTYHEVIRVQDAEIHPPPGITAVVVQGRNRIPVKLHRLAERHLPVRFEYKSDDPVGGFAVDPPEVVVRGPEEILDRTCVMPTQPYLLPPQPDGALASQPITLGPVPLAHELEGRPVRTTPASVNVRLSLRPRRKVFELTLPIRFLCPPDFALRPHFTEEGPAGTVKLKVEGPATEEPPAVTAFIDLTTGKFEQGLHRQPLRLQLPQDCQLVQGAPPLIAFRLDPPDVSVTGAAGNPEP